MKSIRSHLSFRQASAHSAIFLSAAILLGLILTGCNHEQQGIFARIEREVLIKPSDLGQNQNPKQVVLIGGGNTDRNDDVYYTVTSRLNRRSINSGDWREVTQPSGFQDAITVGLARYESGTTEKLLVGFINEAGTTFGLFEYTPSTSQWSDNYYLETPYTNKEITNIIVANGQPFIIVRNRAAPINYNILAFNTSPSATAATRLQQLSWTERVGSKSGTEFGSIIDIAWITNDTEYLFVSQNILYRTPSILTTMPLVKTLPSEYIFQGKTTELTTIFSNENFDRTMIFGGIAVQNNDIYLSDMKGYIYQSRDNGDTWNRSAATSSRYSDLIPLGDTIAVGILDNNSNQEGGMRFINPETLAFTSPAGDGYRSTKIPATSVRRFFVNENRLFVLTEGSGLWSAEYRADDTAKHDVMWRWE